MEICNSSINSSRELYNIKARQKTQFEIRMFDVCYSLISDILFVSNNNNQTICHGVWIANSDICDLHLGKLHNFNSLFFLQSTLNVQFPLPLPVIQSTFTLNSPCQALQNPMTCNSAHANKLWPVRLE